MATADGYLAPPTGCASPIHPVSDSLQRPFTASATRTTSLLAVQVHWGEHVNLAEWAREVFADGDERESPSTYVALRTFRRQDDQQPADNVSRSESQTRSYELRSSPFATTRVAERTVHPVWNEVLLVPMPIEWKNQPDATEWQLRVDLVCRDQSQQEDSLLATASLPVDQLTRGRAPNHILVNLSREQPSPSAQLYLSTFEICHHDDCDDVTEVLIHDIGGFKVEEPSVEAVVVVTTAPAQKFSSITDLFRPLQMLQTHHSDHSTWISPVGRFSWREGLSRCRIQLEFPMTFVQRHGTIGTEVVPLMQHLRAYACKFQSSRIPHRESTIDVAGSGVIDLLAIPQNGQAVPFEVSLEAIDFSGEQGALKLNTTIRRWDTRSWTLFLSATASRRVVTTNRRHQRRTVLQSLKWTGAICRGLNRYPVSSFCDEAGLSGVLGRYLAASSCNGEPSSPRMADDHSANQEQAVRAASEHLSNQHIQLLQQEVTAKQALIQKLQKEIGIKTKGLEMCGAELVIARKALGEQGEMIAQLRAKLDEMEDRDAGQTRAILAASEGVTGLRLDSQGAKRLNMLIFKYKELDRTHRATLADLESAKKSLVAADQLERKYSDLEQAHIIQAALVQKLQKDKSRAAELQRTIRVQEKVIGRLEDAATHYSLHSQSSAGSGPSHANPDSKSEGVRIQVLEHQLESNAKSAATEIGRLKMRILELEAQISLSCSAQGSHGKSQ